MKMMNNKGFTLIELIVVMAVFLFVIGGAIGIFISIIEYQKRLLSEQQLINQISYAEEYMSKALRVAKKEDQNENCLVDALGNDHPGYIYLLTRYDSSNDPSDPTAGAFRGIKFINQSDIDPNTGNPTCEEFFLGNENGDSTAPLVLQEVKGNNSPTDLTPSNLKITSLKFSINGSDGSAASLGCVDSNQCGASELDNVQSRVTMLLGIQIPGDKQEPTRTIETTVSQRNLNAK